MTWFFWFAGLGLVTWMIVSWPWSPSLRQVRAQYGRPGSKFVSIGELSVHVLDEGPRTGPPVLVLPSHWGHFAQWDGWARALSDTYRIVRIDLPGHGLTSLMPDGDYSMDRYVRIVMDVARALSLPKFAIVGSSFSGIVAFRTAAEHPQQVAALILANASGLPRRPGSTAPNAPPPRFIHRLIYGIYRPKSFFAWKLKTLILSHERVTPERVELYTRLNNVRGRIGEDTARVRAYDRGDVSAVLAEVKAPTLVQGSDQSTYLGADDTVRFETLINNAPVQTQYYPGAGHLIMEDIPEKLSADVRHFLDGLSDNTWRTASSEI